MTSNTDRLPPELRSGYVYDQILRAVADSPSDPDRLPDGLAAQGRVTFTPVNPLLQLSSNGRGVHVTKEPVTCTIDPGAEDPHMTGMLVDPAGVSGGVWLPVGRWRVDYRFDDWGTAIPGFQFTVTEEHTEDDPLDLALAAAIPQTPATKFVVNEQVYVDALRARDRAEVAAVAAEEAVSGLDNSVAEAVNEAASLRALMESLEVGEVSDAYVADLVGDADSLVRAAVDAILDDYVPPQQSIVATDIEGVVGDGATDVTGPLNAWLADPGEIRRLTFPPGTFVGSLRVASPGLVIEGQPGATLKVPDDAIQGETDAAMRIIADDVTVKHLRIDGNQRGNPHINTLADAAVADGIGIYANNVSVINSHVVDPIGHGVIVWGLSHLDHPAGLRSGFLIHGNRIEGGSHRAVLDVAFNQGDVGETKGIISNNRLTGNTFVLHSANDIVITGNYSEGISFHTECERLTITGNVNAGHPMNILSGRDVTVMGNVSSSIDVRPGTGSARPEDVTLIGNIVSGPLRVNDSDRITLGMNVSGSLEVNGSTDIAANGNRSGYIALGNISAVSDALLANNKASRLGISHTTDAILTGNKFAGSSTHGIFIGVSVHDTVLRGNVIDNPAGNGIRLGDSGDNSTGVILDSNDIRNVDGIGVYLGPRAIGASVLDNNFSNVTGQEVLDGGVGTIHRGNRYAQGRVIIPPASMIDASLEVRPWGYANGAMFTRFSVSTASTIRRLKFVSDGTGGTIQVGLVKFSNATGFVKVMDSGMIDNPMSGPTVIELDEYIAHPGDYAVFIWASSNEFHTAVTASDYAHMARLNGVLVNAPDGVPNTGNIYETNIRNTLHGVALES